MAVSDSYCPVQGRPLPVTATIRCGSFTGPWFSFAFPLQGTILGQDDLKYSRYPNHIQGLIPRIGDKAAPAPAITKMQDQVTGQFFLEPYGTFPGKRSFSWMACEHKKNVGGFQSAFPKDKPSKGGARLSTLKGRYGNTGFLLDLVGSGSCGLNVQIDPEP
jgi:hypothetical protein